MRPNIWFICTDDDDDDWLTHKDCWAMFTELNVFDDLKREILVVENHWSPSFVALLFVCRVYSVLIIENWGLGTSQTKEIMFYLLLQDASPVQTYSHLAHLCWTNHKALLDMALVWLSSSSWQCVKSQFQLTPLLKDISGFDPALNVAIMKRSGSHRKLWSFYISCWVTYNGSSYAVKLQSICWKDSEEWWANLKAVATWSKLDCSLMASASPPLLANWKYINSPALGFPSFPIKKIGYKHLTLSVQLWVN